MKSLQNIQKVVSRLDCSLVEIQARGSSEPDRSYLIDEDSQTFTRDYLQYFFLKEEDRINDLVPSSLNISPDVTSALADIRDSLAILAEMRTWKQSGTFWSDELFQGLWNCVRRRIGFVRSL